jgi:hypothetical protein
MFDGVEVQVHREVPGEYLVSRGHVLVRFLDGGSTTLEDIDFACELFDRMLERHSAIAVLAVIEHGTPVPPHAVRVYNGERFGSYGDRVVIGVCMLGLGFWAKAAYAAVTMIMRFSSKKTTTVLETNLEALASRMALELVGLDPEGLVEFCEQIRSQRAAVRRAELQSRRP